MIFGKNNSIWTSPILLMQIDIEVNLQIEDDCGRI